MEIKILNRKDEVLFEATVTPESTLLELKKDFSKTKGFAISRQYFTLNEIRGTQMRDNKLTMKNYGIKNGDVVYFKDLGPQISYSLVFLIEYVGPLIIFPLVYIYPCCVYGEEYAKYEKSCIQKTAFWMIIGHFVKRELETIFVHRFSNATMPLKQLFINSTHYWIFNGIFVSYFLLHPKYTHASYHEYVFYGIFTFFCLAEVMNLFTHVILRNLRPKGTSVRGIPRNCGFGLVSCANYFWEIMIWISFAIFTQLLTAIIFTSLTFLILQDWARTRHRKYKKEFPDYPKNRKALIPFIL